MSFVPRKVEVAKLNDFYVKTYTMIKKESFKEMKENGNSEIIDKMKSRCL